MYRKLDNDAWEEYLNKFNSVKDTITVKDFCAENNLNKSQFYYHKKKIENGCLSQGQVPIFDHILRKNKLESLSALRRLCSHICHF